MACTVLFLSMRFSVKVFLLLGLLLSSTVYFLYEKSVKFQTKTEVGFTPLVKKILLDISAKLEQDGSELKKTLFSRVQRYENKGIKKDGLNASNEIFTWLSRFEKNSFNQWQSVWIESKKNDSNEKRIVLDNIYSFLSAVELSENNLYVVPLDGYKQSIIISLVSASTDEKNNAIEKTIVAGITDLGKWEKMLSSYDAGGVEFFLFDNLFVSKEVTGAVSEEFIKNKITLKLREKRKNVENNEKIWVEARFLNNIGIAVEVSEVNTLVGALLVDDSGGLGAALWLEWKTELMVALLSFLVLGSILFCWLLGGDDKFLEKLNKTLKLLIHEKSQAPIAGMLSSKQTVFGSEIILSLKELQNKWLVAEPKIEVLPKESDQNRSTVNVEAVVDGFAQKLFKPMQDLNKMAIDGKNINRREDIEACLSSIQNKSSEIISVLQEVSSGSMGGGEKSKRQNEVFNMLKLVNSSLSQLSGELLRKNIKIKKVFKDVPDMRGDVFKLQTSINQILQNAVEAIEDADQRFITVKLYEESGELHLNIEDNGVGMELSEVKNVFTPFYSNKSNRLGLGMSSVLSAVREHFGEIKIKSKKNEGTKVFLLFPIVKK